MKTLNEQIGDILKGSGSLKKKRETLISLGLKSTDISNLFKVYDVRGPRQLLHTIGVEIECYNVIISDFIARAREKGVNIENEHYNHDTKRHYKIVPDRSIDGQNAIECVSPILGSKTGLKSLRTVCAALNECGATVNRSTGLHVHVGLRGIDFSQYKNIIMNYIKLERVIDEFMPQSRRKNNCEYAYSMRRGEGIISYVKTSEDMRDIADAYNYSRYLKVNPCSYRVHNTIEFRQHSGTTDFVKISNWINFIIKLVDYSKENRIEGDINTIDEIPFLNSKEKNYFNERAAALR